MRFKFDIDIPRALDWNVLYPYLVDEQVARFIGGSEFIKYGLFYYVLGKFGLAIFTPIQNPVTLEEAMRKCE